MFAVVGLVAVRFELGQHCIEIPNAEAEAVWRRRLTRVVSLIRVDTPHVVRTAGVIRMGEREETTPPLLMQVDPEVVPVPPGQALLVVGANEHATKPEHSFHLYLPISATLLACATSYYVSYMLKFPLLGIPVGVHLTFLFVALLGATAYSGVDIAIWTAAAFVSILLHEMGHALTARAFGAEGITVTLYGLGGVTNYRHGVPMSHGRSFLISAAGSATGIIAGGAVLLVARSGAFGGVSHEVAVFLDSFIFTALVWGVLNWVPIVPLDGGHMVQSLASMVSEEKGPLIAQVVTWIAVAIVVPLAVMNGYDFAAIIVVVFAFSGLRQYRATAARTAAKNRPPTVPEPAPPAAPTPQDPQSEFPI